MVMAANKWHQIALGKPGHMQYTEKVAPGTPMIDYLFVALTGSPVKVNAWFK